MKKQLIVILLLAAGFSALAQTKPDSVVVKVGKASKVVVTVGDKSDLETFRKYNFQQLMDDIIQKLDVRDTSQVLQSSQHLMMSAALPGGASEFVVYAFAHPLCTCRTLLTMHRP